MLRLAESDPRRAIVAASDVVRTAVAERDMSAAAIAERAWGLAALHLGDIDDAVAHLREAVRHGRRARSTELVASARVTLAGLLADRGSTTAALRELDVALSDLTGLDRARAEAQRGAILHQIGKLDEAMRYYRVSLPTLRRADPVWAARTLMNQGILHGQRQEFGAGMDNLRTAEQLYRELDLTLSVGFVHQNQGFVQACRGDVPAALAFFDRAERCFRQLGSQLGELLSDRAELLLSVRLTSEARQAADSAVHAFEREGRGMPLPEARLTAARIALLDGHVDQARAHARKAVAEFTRQHRPEWVALARLALLDCELAEPAPGRGMPRVEATAATVAELWPAAAVDAWLIAGQLLLRRNRSTQGERLLALAAKHRTRGPATDRSQAWLAEAMLRHRAGNRTGALHAIRAGLRVLDEHVASLGATDLRAHTAGHRTELADLGLRLALESKRPERIFQWAEVGRASQLLRPPARPPDDPALAGTVAELRSTMANLRQQRRTGQRTVALDRRLITLEHAVRDHHRQRTGPGSTRLPALSAADIADALASTLPDAVLLEFFQLDGALHVVVVADGRMTVRGLGPLDTVRDLVDRLPFVLRRLTRPTMNSEGRAAAQQLLRNTVVRLDSVLFGAIPEIGDHALALIPTGPLQSVPWALLPSCSGRPVTVSPSAALLWAASREPATDGGPAVVASGPGLPGAQHEADTVAAIHGSKPLTGDAADVATVTSALDGARLAHLATHGHVRADNPLFSSLELADGPLMVYDLERLDRAPDTVVLAACDTGRPVVRAGDELLGLGATLLAQGTRRLVAPVLAVLDLDTAPLMIAFHRHLAAGRSVAAALAAAQQDTRDVHPAGPAAVSGFVCMGAGLTGL